MKPIIEPIERSVLEQELTPALFVRNTNRVDNQIYIFSASQAPSVMREVGRLREVSFRDAGGGTGADCDVDADDLADKGYKQLIVWDSTAREIVGGYRFIISTNENPKHLSTEHYFQFSDKFRNEFLPYTIELGRSFIQPKYQSRNNNKSIFALDNLWDGLGALIRLYPQARYFFGKVTMYTDYQKDARNMLIYFMRRYFPDPDQLMQPLNPVQLNIDYEEMATIFSGDSYEQNYRILVHKVRELNENIPPLINSYISLSPTMRVFDTVTNLDFGGVEETGILVTIPDIYPQKSQRHTDF